MTRHRTRHPRAPHRSKAPELLWLELTTKCNLACVHCYTESSPLRPLREQMTLEDWKTALLEGRSLGCQAVQFIGGEVTLHPELCELIESARACGYTRVEVYTNGVHFSEKLREALTRHRVELLFGVHSDHAEEHDRVTQRRGSFDHTVANIRWALAQRLKVRVGHSETPLNPGSADRTATFLKGLGVPYVRTDRVRAIGNGVRLIGERDRYAELCGSCASTLAVTASGNIYPCVFSRFHPVGEFHDGLTAAWKGASRREFRARLRKATRDAEVGSASTGAGAGAPASAPAPVVFLPMAR